jgi:hypothetical protein
VTLRTYLVGALKWWWVLVAGLATGLIGLVLDLRTNLQLPTWLWPAIFGVAVIAAQFLTFRDLHVKYQILMIQLQARPQPVARLKAATERVGLHEHRLVITNAGDLILREVSWHLPANTQGWNLLPDAVPMPWPELQPRMSIRVPLVFTMPTTPNIELILRASSEGVAKEWKQTVTLWG